MSLQLCGDATGVACAEELPPPTAADQIPGAVPHCTSFDHFPDARTRRAKEYEQYLLFALDRFPEYACRLELELRFARLEAERSTTSDQDAVLRALEAVSLTVTELMEDTQLPRSTVYKILQSLVSAGLVGVTSRPGAHRKPRCVYELTHTQL